MKNFHNLKSTKIKYYMEYILKVKTKFDCMLSLNNIYKRKLEESGFQTFKLDIKENENLTIFVV